MSRGFLLELTKLLAFQSSFPPITQPPSPHQMSLRNELKRDEGTK